MKLITLIVLGVAGTCAYAQVLEKGVIPFSAEGVVSSPVQVREAPPYGLLNLFVGKGIKTIPQGEKINILGKKTYAGFSGAHVWYQVGLVDKQGSDQMTIRWVYGGVEGQDSPIQLEKITK